MTSWHSATGDAPAAERVAAVTGASVGLGRAIATALGGLGWRVAIGARRADRLAETEEAVRKAGGQPFAHPLDVRSGASVQRFFAAAQDALGPVQSVVINAGIAFPGLLADVDAEEHRAVIETNLLGAIYCSREAILRWRAADLTDGDLLFISSETAQRPWPHNVVYSASKAGLEHVANGLRFELDGSGARVMTVQLGPAASEFGFGIEPEKLVRSLEAWQEARVWNHPSIMSPEQVARSVVFALTAPRTMEVHDLVIKPTRPPTSGDPAGD